MNFRLLISFALVSLQFSLGFTDQKVLDKKPIIKDVIVSPDSPINGSHVKQEVDIISEAINGEVPIPTFLQLHDTSDVRTKIKDAIGHGKYAQGSAPPDNVNVRLNAKKDEDLLNALNMAKVQQELADKDDDPLNILNVANVQQEVFDDGDGANTEDADEDDSTSTKKDLSKTHNLGAFDAWLQPSAWQFGRQLKANHGTPMGLKDLNVATFLQFPLFVKLRNGFVRNGFGFRKN